VNTKNGIDISNVTRLEIGSGNKPVPGYTRIDIEPHQFVDIVGDFRTMTFSNLEEVRSHHLLEHFGYDESIEVLKLWKSWLMIGGRLTVETPDFGRICEVWNEKKYWADKEHLAKHAYGSQEADWAYHKSAWYKEKFQDILPKIGFYIELIKQKHSYIRYGEKRTRYRFPNILVIAKRII